MAAIKITFIFAITLLATGCASPNNTSKAQSIEITELQIKNASFYLRAYAVNYQQCKGVERLVSPDLSSKKNNYITSNTGYNIPVTSMKFTTNCGEFTASNNILFGSRGYVGMENKKGSIETIWIDPK